jgi:uncharacterized protein (TIGR02646 family)
MIRIVKGRAPKKLLTDGVTKTREHCKRYNTNSAKYNRGDATFEFSANIYGHPTVKAALEKAQSGKCCYCEVFIETPYALSHVEHYRPKAYSQQARKGPKNYPGYYWLVYDWSNLFLACHFCNSGNKKNLFPLRHEARRARNHHGNIHLEEPLIICPGGPEDPRNHIVFHNEVPVGKTPAGKITVDVLGLDRPKHESRLRLFQQLETFHSYVVSPDHAPRGAFSRVWPTGAPAIRLFGRV